MVRHMRKFLSVFATLLAFATLLSAPQPWDAPFNPDTKATLEAARAVAAGDANAVVLLEEYLIKLDDTGRRLMVHRRVVRIVNKDSVERWASLEREYAPWREM